MKLTIHAPVAHVCSLILGLCICIFVFGAPASYVFGITTPKFAIAWMQLIGEWVHPAIGIAAAALLGIMFTRFEK